MGGFIKKKFFGLKKKNKNIKKKFSQNLVRLVNVEEEVGAFNC